MKILAITPTLSSRYGGSIASAVRIAIALSRRHSVTVWSTDIDFDNAYPDVMRKCDVRIFRAWDQRICYCPSMAGEMAKAVGNVDSINVFGLWTYPSMCALGAYRRRRSDSSSLFVHSQGLLLPVALRHHKLRKEVASKLFTRRATADIRGFVACNQVEVDQIRQWGSQAPVYVLPNPVTAPKVIAGAYRSRLNIPQDVPIVGYMNRFHPIKRVKELCDGFIQMQRRNENIRFVFAGDFNNEYGLAVKSRAEALGLKANFVGHLAGDEKWEFLADCTVLCQFSSQEGHSNAILEALALGVPVVVSRGCNAPEVQARNAGVVVDSVEDLASATIAIIENPYLRGEMSRNAKRLVAEEYSGDIWVRRFEDIMARGYSYQDIARCS